MFSCVIKRALFSSVVKKGMVLMCCKEGVLMCSKEVQLIFVRELLFCFYVSDRAMLAPCLQKKKTQQTKPFYFVVGALPSGGGLFLGDPSILFIEGSPRPLQRAHGETLSRQGEYKSVYVCTSYIHTSILTYIHTYIDTYIHIIRDIHTYIYKNI